MVARVNPEPEHFAGNVEGTDLATSVRQQPEQAHHAILNLIEGSGAVALRVDFAVGGVKLHLAGLRIRKRSTLTHSNAGHTGGTCAFGYVSGIMACAIGEHCVSPVFGCSMLV